MKRYRLFLMLGLFALLLMTAGAFSHAPADRTDASGFAPSSHGQSASLIDTSRGLVICAANPIASSFSRLDPSPLHALVPPSVVPVQLNVQGLGIAGVLPFAARETGFHLLLRAPPLCS